MTFKNKVVLITGSSKGVGKATALQFAKEGAIVVLNHLNSEKEAKEVLHGIQKTSDGIIIKCDVSDEKQVENMFEKIMHKFGRLDILINNAGTYFDGDEWNGSPQVWEKTLKNNLVSAMITSKYATEIFQKQKSGVIVNIASRFSVSGQFDALAYSASKAGLVNITQAYAKLLAPFGRVYAISPWPIRSGYWIRAQKEELDEVISKIPAKRLLEPEEVANVVLYLCSDEATKINGQNILVDGINRKI